MSGVPNASALEDTWARHAAEWRDSAQIASQWREAAGVDPAILAYTVRGSWWETLAECGITLFIAREYEHLVVALRGGESRPHVTYMPMPHPSGLAIDRERGLVYLASTRNPNQIFDLAPVAGIHERLDVDVMAPKHRPLVPVRSRFLPGSLYVHDLAMIGGALYANAVGCNAVARLEEDGRYELVWWPKAIDRGRGRPLLGRNHLQLNSIAAGEALRSSYFSASTDRVSARRPGHRNFPVDRRGVIFSGATREPIVRGLTRPHSARLHDGALWVENSGYGQLVVCDLRAGTFQTAATLPGWTRGLCFQGRIAFVGTSRVIPRFRQYAPGLDIDRSVCGVHAVDLGTGATLGSIIWPRGNQVFAVEWAPQTLTTGFPFALDRRGAPDSKKLFYAFRVAPEGRKPRRRASPSR